MKNCFKALAFAILCTFGVHTAFAQCNESLFTGGDGKTEQTAYQISTAQQLQNLSKCVTNSIMENKYYVLNNDIDLSDYLAGEGNNGGVGWNPIGNSSSVYFTGKFNGNGHKVSGLWIRRNLALGYLGLFGHTSYFAEIKNIGVEIDDNKGGISGGSYVGGLVGYADGSISNSYVIGNVSGTSNVGGLVGSNKGTISNSYAMGNVSGSSYYVGGLVGQNNGTISRSYAMGSVSTGSDVGGLVGSNYLSIVNNSYYDKETSGMNDTGKGIGKTTAEMKTQSTYVGFDFEGIWEISSGKNNGYPILGWQNNPNHIASAIVTPISDQPWTGDTITPKPSVNFKGSTLTRGTHFEYAYDNNVQTGTATLKIVGKGIYSGSQIVEFKIVPATCGTGFAGGNGTLSNPYKITEAKNLDAINNCLGESYKDKYYELKDNINLSSYIAKSSVGWRFIGDHNSTDKSGFFYGKFNGNGYKVSGLWINGEEGARVGLFGTIYEGGEIKNMGVEIDDSNGGVKFLGGNNTYVGGLAIVNSGTISNSYVTGNVIGGGTSAIVGGLVGSNGGTISNSYATGNVIWYGTSANVGGLVGTNQGTISNSYATGSVSGTGSYVGGLVGASGTSGTISNSYATGSVSGTGSYVGGLVGYRSGATISSSYYNSETSGMNDTGKGEGKTTAEMKTQSTYLGWDFAGTWTMINGSYPILKWQKDYVPTYTISFNLDGGSGTTPANIANIAQGSILSTAQMPSTSSFTKSGYVNDGKWYIRTGISPNYTYTEFVFGSGGTPVTAYATLCLKWISTYTITFNANGGTVTPTSGTTNIGGTLASLPTPTRDGYTFNGWFTAATSGTAVTTSTVFNANATIYAQWRTLSNIASATISAIPNQIYTGSAIEPTFTLTFDETVLTKNTDYSVSYSNNRNVGTAKVTITGVGNYIGSAEADFTITAKPVTITGLSAANKEYDGTTTATITGTAVVSGKVGSDVVTVTNGTASFANKNIGTGKPVTFTGFTLSGTDAGNYTLSAQPASVTANITAKPLTLTVTSITATNKVYDGTTTAEIHGTDNIIGKVSGDDITIVKGNASFNDKNVGTNKPVTFKGFSYGGADINNYTVSEIDTISGVTANITAKPVTITGVTAISRIDNGTKTVELTGGTLNGVLSGDVVGFTLGNGTIASATAGNDKPVTTDIKLTGTDASNYTLTQPTNITVTITAAPSSSSSSVAPSSSSVVPSSSSSVPSSSSVAPSSSSSVPSSSSSVPSSSSVAPSSSSVAPSSSSKGSSSSTAPVVVADKCGTSTINPDKQFCYNDKVYSLCNGEEYDPETNKCSGTVLQSKCGKSSWYDDEKQFCWNDTKVYSLCGGSSYDPDDEKCQNGEVVSKTTPIQQITSVGNILVHTSTNAIELSNLPSNAKVEVYNLQGKRIYSTTSHSPLATSHLKIEVQTGMYIVKVGTQTMRIAVR